MARDQPVGDFKGANIGLVLACPGLVLGLSWACPGLVLDLSWACPPVRLLTFPWDRVFPEVLASPWTLKSSDMSQCAFVPIILQLCPLKQGSPREMRPYIVT